MKILKCLAVVATIVLALASQSSAGGGVTTSEYTVASTTDEPGLNTGLILKKGRSVTVTATGSVCPTRGIAWAPMEPPWSTRRRAAPGASCCPALPHTGSLVASGQGRGCRSAVGRRLFPGRGRSCLRSTMTSSVTTRAASWSLCPTRNRACCARVGQDGATATPTTLTAGRQVSPTSRRRPGTRLRTHMDPRTSTAIPHRRGTRATRETRVVRGARTIRMKMSEGALSKLPPTRLPDYQLCGSKRR
jgi:hypothetical protein